MAHFGRGQTHAPIIRHGRVPPVPPVVYTDTCSGMIALLGNSVDYPSYSAMILATSGLVSYWRLGEASGNFLDSKGPNPATTVAGGFTRQAPGLLTSDANGAVRGDGAVGTWANVPSNASLNTAAVTVEFWVKPTVVAGIAAYLIYRGVTGGYFFDLVVGRWRWYVRPTGGDIQIDTASAPADKIPAVGVRQHVVGTYSAVDGARLYVNGVQVATTAGGLALGATTTAQFFATSSSSASFPGTLDEIALYSTVLTAQQVLDHYNAGAPPVPVTNSDAPSGTISLTGTKTESKSVADSRSGSLALTGTNTDSKVVADSRTGTIALTGTRVESVSRSDTAIGSIALSGTRIESYARVYTDSRTGSLALSGSATDNKVYTDVRPGTITLSGTRVEQRVCTDVRAGTIKLSGSIIESWSVAAIYTDSLSGTIALDGWIENEAWAFPLSTLHDDFDTIDTSIWNYDGSDIAAITIDSGRLKLRSWEEEIPDGFVVHEPSLYANASYLLDAPLVIEVDGTDPNCKPELYLESRVWNPDLEYKVFVGAYIYAHQSDVPDVRNLSFVIEGYDESYTDISITYDPDEHRWWKIWLDSTTMRLLTSPDGLVWTEQLSVADWQGVNVPLGLYVDSRSINPYPEPYPDSSAYFDNLNVLLPIAYSDSPIGTIRLSGSVAEQRVYSDARAGTIVLSGTCTSTHAKSYNDSRTGTVALSGTCTSTHLKSYTDSRAGTLVLSGTCTSTHVKFYTDTSTGSITLLGTRSEASVRADSPTGLLKLLGTAAESLSRGDSPTGVLRLTGTASDASSRTSTATGLLRLSGSALESASTANNFSDNPVGTLALSGTCISTLIRVYNDSPTGRLTLSGTCTSVQSYSDSRTGTLALTGTATSTHANNFSDNPVGTLTLGGTCTSTLIRAYNDSPTGRMTLAGTAADFSQRIVAPVGLLRLSGASAESRAHTDTCAGVLALIGVVSQTLAYVDQRTGRLILNGTAVDDHFIVVSDHVAGTLRLSGRATDSWAAEGRVDYDDYPLATLPLSGRLILPGVRPDDGIGRARIGAFETGRVVLNLTGRLSAPQTGRVVANLTGSLRR